MRFAAAEISLELHHRVAALTRDPLHHAYEQSLEALSEGSSAKELDWLFVFVGPLAHMNLPEVRGKLGLLVTAAGHIFVRRHHFPPSPQVGRRGAFDSGPCPLAL